MLVLGSLDDLVIRDLRTLLRQRWTCFEYLMGDIHWFNQFVTICSVKVNHVDVETVHRMNLVYVHVQIQGSFSIVLCLFSIIKCVFCI